MSIAANTEPRSMLLTDLAMTVFLVPEGLTMTSAAAVNLVMSPTATITATHGLPAAIGLHLRVPAIIDPSKRGWRLWPIVDPGCRLWPRDRAVEIGLVLDVAGRLVQVAAIRFAVLDRLTWPVACRIADLVAARAVAVLR